VERRDVGRHKKSMDCIVSYLEGVEYWWRRFWWLW